MTRINVGVSPKELSDRHLIAEHREIKRIPNVVRMGKFSLVGQPTKFTLGTGHVKFFYDKIGYLKDRYLQIHAECLARGFSVSNFIGAFDGIPMSMMGGYIPSEADRQAILERIAIRNEEAAKRKLGGGK